jgi:large subunit ribosomal protein L26e
VKYTLMSANLCKELREKHGIRSLPIRRDDEVEIVRGGDKVKGKVNTVYRKRWCLYIEKATRNRKNGALIKIPIDPSNCVITKLKLTPDREALIARKRAGRGKDKGKYTTQDVNK